MDFLKLRFYIELLSLVVGITLLICVLPIQAIVEGKIRILTVGLGALLWFTIIRYNETFHLLIDKWFKGR